MCSFGSHSSSWYCPFSPNDTITPCMLLESSEKKIGNRLFHYILRGSVGDDAQPKIDISFELFIEAYIFQKHPMYAE